MQMDSLTDLKNYFLINDVEIKSFNGYELNVKKDRWTMAHYTLYCNGKPVNRKDKKFFHDYTERNKNVKHQSSETRKWRGISCRNRDRG